MMLLFLQQQTLYRRLFVHSGQAGFDGGMDLGAEGIACVEDLLEDDVPGRNDLFEIAVVGSLGMLAVRFGGGLDGGVIVGGSDISYCSCADEFKCGYGTVAF
eukprot:scaffold154708_cov36-Cyclotella_meneghiniana.AAC.2